MLVFAIHGLRLSSRNMCQQEVNKSVKVNIQVISSKYYYEGGYSTESLGCHFIFTCYLRVFYQSDQRWEEESSYVHLRLNGNSLEIARIMKNWIFGRIIQYLTIKFTGNFRKKVGFRVLSLFFQGNQGHIYGQFASYLHLLLISGDYGGYMWVI